MKQELQKLFADLHLFSSLVANVRLSNLTFDVYHLKKADIEVDLIFAKKAQFAHLQEAFSALFKKELFDGEEWDIHEEPEPNDKQWLHSLQEVWIKEYFLNKSISMKVVDDNTFLSRLQRDLRDVNAPESVVHELLLRLNNLEAIQMKQGHVYDYIFGQSESEYFVFEWGIYV
ncbi:hypothetical protein [Metabacillus niabensis]|uniref:hypothetical protein n=1 Tax=Metabacillus niabensis TaxID=324854 RepID=UPI0039A08AA3